MSNMACQYVRSDRWQIALGYIALYAQLDKRFDSYCCRRERNKKEQKKSRWLSKNKTEFCVFFFSFIWLFQLFFAVAFLSSRFFMTSKLDAALSFHLQTL